VPLKTENIQGETWFKIADHDAMRPFFMSIVSDSNHWMFISSNGGLSAGRKNADFALFPYYTDDKIAESAHITGSKTIMQVTLGGDTELWEPFSAMSAAQFDLSRNLYKNRYGNKVMFEEVNHDLGLVFRFEWNSSNGYGFVRKATLKNISVNELKVKVLDGIQNILPHGVGSDLQNRQSNLVDAYKRSELIAESGLGIFALSAIIVDRAEPSEALKANVVWSLGLKNPTFLLSSLQLDSFRNGASIHGETDMKGEKGAYFAVSDINLSENTESSWCIIANVNQNQSDIVALSQAMVRNSGLLEAVLEDVELGTQNLIKLVAAADGLQYSSDLLSDTRHFSNTLFNIMRGGIFDHNYQIEKGDFSNYLRNANRELHHRSRGLLASLPEVFDLDTLRGKQESMDDADLERLATEYLPLKFSRRHGDPSRPWNKFSINTRSEVDGSKILNYEGNWRDIFQNWEALLHSYPDFVEGMIFKFLNATTFDGYNPYRITKDGFDWEVVEPEDPWSFIGYWGDHQIIYLLKFLEFQHNYSPESFKALFGKESFVYANVPYRIKPYAEILKNPKDTIEFDGESDRSIRQKVASKGADGALANSRSRAIHHVSFLEKILATLLAKLSNFIPEAGIWMNTQRPEWNDANNALVGNGVSMVTLYYLRRFLTFFQARLGEVESEELKVSRELHEFFGEIKSVLQSHVGLLKGKIDDRRRKAVIDGLGLAGSAYRGKVYDHGFSGEVATLRLADVREFAEAALQHLEHAISANRRDNKLYHAYNLIHIKGDSIRVSHLSEMLEGQVAALSSGHLNVGEALEVLDALRKSELYRADQHSYMLYPNKQLPGFLEKNTLPKTVVENSTLLKTMLADGDTRIVNKDVNGNYHFNGDFKNADYLKKTLEGLKSTRYETLVEADMQQILDSYEAVFDHKSFTGRSGTFFAYEGLGSIYWHMVSKLHFAVLEICRKAADEGADKSVMERLAKHFDEIGKGIGVHKDPKVYGAFPTDPYSHTPWHRGAQQPGMTGQVKEDVLVRFGELGVKVAEGCLRFEPGLLDSSAFVAESCEVEFIDLERQPYTLSLPENSLAFTVCKVPVVYCLGGKHGMEIHFADGLVERFEEAVVDADTSEGIFERRGEVKQVKVTLVV